MSDKRSTHADCRAMDWAGRILSGDRLAVSRAISAIEDQTGVSLVIEELLAALHPHTGRAHLVGITGAPGTGKSTLASQLARAFCASNRLVGIVAVDPTSPFSGGALLGDRIRMRDVASDPRVFVRSMATRGRTGGLSRAVYGAVQVLDAAGYDPILIETVGAGQDEVEIATLAHTVVVVEAPGLGDDIQAIKAGLFEIADVFCVNKADREGAPQAVHALEAMQRLGAGGRSASVWLAPILQTVATEGVGLPELVQCLSDHWDYMRRSDAWHVREIRQARAHLESEIRERLYARFQSGLAEGRFDEIAAQVAGRGMTFTQALDELGVE